MGAVDQVKSTFPQISGQQADTDSGRNLENSAEEIRIEWNSLNKNEESISHLKASEVEQAKIINYLSDILGKLFGKKNISYTFAFRFESRRKQILQLWQRKEIASK